MRNLNEALNPIQGSSRGTKPFRADELIQINSKIGSYNQKTFRLCRIDRPVSPHHIFTPRGNYWLFKDAGLWRKSTTADCPAAAWAPLAPGTWSCTGFAADIRVVWYFGALTYPCM